MSWNNTNTIPNTSWSTTSQVDPNTSYETTSTGPNTNYTTTTTPADLTWQHFAYLLWGDDKMWGQLEFNWGVE